MKKILSFFVILLLVLSSVNISFGADSCKTEEIPNASNLVYSSDGKSSAYILTKNNGKQVVVKDGVEGKEYANISNLIYSPMGASFAYIVKKGNLKMLVVKDGVEDKEYEKIFYLLYSPNGKSFVYIAIRDGFKRIIVKDGIEGKKYNSIFDLKYSPDSKNISYYAYDSNFKTIIVKNGEELNGMAKNIYFLDIKNNIYYLQNEYFSKILLNFFKNKKYTSIGNLLSSPNNKSISYVAFKANGKQVLVKDGIEGKEYKYIVNPSLKYSPDSKNISYAVKTVNNKAILVKDGIEYKKYDSNSNFQVFLNLLYSPNGKYFSYILFKSNGKQVVVKNGIEGKEYNRIFGLKYSPDSKSFSYMASNTDLNNSFLVKDGIEIINASNLLYSPDGKSFSYILTKNNLEQQVQVLVKDGVKGKEYNVISNMQYSLDGKSFSYNGDVTLIRQSCNNNIITKTKPQLFKQLILSKRELKKSFKGRKNISTIDLIVKKLPKVKLEILMGKLKKIDTNLVKFRKYKNMLGYLEAKVGLELLK